MEMKENIEKYVGDSGLLVSVKEPSEMVDEPGYEDLKVSKWRISIETSPARKDLPNQKIKIEVCNVPAYTKSPRALNINYDFLPDGYDNILIMTESLDEIMADKFVSLVNNTKYVRNRDIWDLRWLKQKGAEINTDFISSKIKDYKVKNYFGKLNKMMDQMDNIIKGKEFYNEMSRFIPADVQEETLKKEKFLLFLSNEIRSLLLNVKRRLEM